MYLKSRNFAGRNIHGTKSRGSKLIKNFKENTKGYSKIKSNINQVSECCQIEEYHNLPIHTASSED